jgi:serine-type D-Ala-D-Ala carboxypeptidase/endopeptidase (penicillin-binding protein 4)
MRSGSILAGGLVGLVLAGCGASADHSRPLVKTASRVPAVKTASRVPAAAPVRAAPPPPAPSPALLALQRTLLAAFRSAGPNSAGVVYDVTSGSLLFSLRGQLKLPPASVEKLYTSVAVLDDLGPSARLQTTVLGAGHLGPGGIWHGNLYLRGGGDPSFGDGTFNQVWEDGYGPTAQQLTRELRAAGIRRVTGLLIGDPSLFDSRRGGPATGYAPDIPDLGGQLAGLTYDHGSTIGRLSPGAFAARELALTLRGAGIKAQAARRTANTPLGAQPLASVSSPPVSVLLRLTDVPSDDFFAEMLTKQLGVRFGGSGSTSAGATVIAGAIAAYGVHPAIVDGSGLSRRDLSSPLEVVDLLRSLWPTPTGAMLRTALPLVGVNGTVQRIGVHTPAQGRCLAKTGTLDNVTNLAGYCHSRAGQVLAFALFLDGPPNPQGTLLLGQMVAAVARY